MRTSINAALALLLGLLLAAAPDARRAAAQEPRQDTGYGDFSLFFYEFFVPKPVKEYLGYLSDYENTTTPEERARQARENTEARTARNIDEAYREAFYALRSTDKGARRRFREQHRRLTYYVSSDSLSIQARLLARAALDQLPQEYVPGFLYKNPDGSVVAEQDPNLAAQLMRERGTANRGDGGGGGDGD
jgi:hypothetical protein